MKLEKVNENQIRCTLTREDLLSRKLNISELAYGTEKAKNLFRDMMQQAHYEFGFEAEDIPLMIEAIPLNAECIVLIITKVDDPEELDTRFARFAPSVLDDEYYEEEDGQPHQHEILDLFRKLKESVPDGEKPTAGGDTPEKELTRIFRMDSLQQVMNTATVTASCYEGESALYKDTRTEHYLLALSQGDCSREVFDRTCNIISEYGDLLRNPSASASVLAEHCEVLIAENALQKLNA